jgi:aminoglycoside phosphotransferase (APT) family kinase protein
MSVTEPIKPFDKNAPSPSAIEQIRARFPTEPEIDRVLTRKMSRRAGPGYSAVSLDVLVSGVEALLRDVIAGPFRISNPRWLAGGASKVQMAFRLDQDAPKENGAGLDLVLRMDPCESLNESSRLREFQLLKAFEGVVPAPKGYWVDHDAKYLPNPALICGFVHGVTKPTASDSRVTGIGTRFAPEFRHALGHQWLDHLARIHTQPIDRNQLSAFSVPGPGKDAAIIGLNMWERVWEEDFCEDIPLMRLAAAWLRSEAPVCEKPVILHCDYRVGNFLFDETDKRISAILDWEGGRIGDFHQDLAWTTAPAYGQLDESGTRFLIGGMLELDEFLEIYQQQTGYRVSSSTLSYYRVLVCYIQCVMTFATAYRIARNGKTHQDIVQTFLLGFGPTLLEGMRATLERAW